MCQCVLVLGAAEEGEGQRDTLVSKTSTEASTSASSLRGGRASVFGGYSCEKPEKQIVPFRLAYLVKTLGEGHQSRL